MLAALGTPSKTEPIDQAMLNRMRTMPKVSPDQDSQLSWYRLEKCHRKMDDPVVNKPRQYQVKLIFSLPPFHSTNHWVLSF